MTDFTLRASDVPANGIAALSQLLRDMLRSTPLGIAIAIAQGKR